ncbi:ferritin-like domain-containing protein [Chryseobacterium sp. SL1]|uniref:ferritin-like domain-containing protein n=1 Tax=Chryseobacterium sp. SL1 TaxID=2995159 RepID=UPI002272BEB9|nr:ferritin-like protein [Chryseobacterium sp. SL1]MCY1661613.1 ferritin-like protein [Chryseobacterium sp. SL1]
MRQRLINKTEPQENSSLLRSSSEKNIIVDEAISLQSLLFDNTNSKENWIEGIKYHSKNVTNLLLNNQIDAFNGYLRSQFGGEVPEINPTADFSGEKAFQVKKGLENLDYRPILQDLLQTAILIEHSTIPPYLTALYSIKDGTNILPSQIIRSVAVEEMLHMIMVCNVMNAVSIQPSVNRPQNYPNYPMKLPLNVDFYVGLETFSSNSIATFIAIESPSNPLVKAPKYDYDAQPEAMLSRGTVQENNLWTLENMKDFIMKNVHTIGEYYDVVFFYIVVFQIIAYYKANGRLPQTFEELNKGGIFTGDPAKQIRPEQYYGSGGKLYPVDALEGVILVFQEIKGQGEGADDSIFDVDPSQFEEGAELAHYFRFKEIFHEHFYLGGDYRPFTDENGMMPVTTPPVGKPLPVDWSAAYPMKPNPKMSDYQSNPQLFEQGKQFNVTYKKLLDAIQAAVEGHSEELAKSIMYMYALKEQAIGLMSQPLTSQYNAGPTFEYPAN